MRFTEIVSRIAGFSVPVFWHPVEFQRGRASDNSPRPDIPGRSARVVLAIANLRKLTAHTCGHSPRRIARLG
jgi:hypothetical protein